MIETTQENTQVRGNMSGKDVRMAIHADAMKHVMKQLTDLYSDRETAVLRELSTNALDAHVEAGNSAPIEVELPASLKPNLVVRDHGTGLNAHDIETIYSQYGASTKRGSNDVVGMLGFGCKSPLALADQFTLVGIKGGIRTQVVITRDASGGGTMKIVSATPTTEPNGVEITVPSAMGNQFKQKATEFFGYWKPGTVLVDGKEPVSHLENAIKVTEDLYVREKIAGGAGNHMVVMGNVAYPVDGSHQARLPNLPWRWQIIAFVPIGAVEFPASREALKYTEHTLQALAKITHKFSANAPAAVQRHVDAATTKPLALEMARTWATPFNVNIKELKWRGESIQTALSSKKWKACERHYGLRCSNDDAKKGMYAHGEHTCPGCIKGDQPFVITDAYNGDWNTPYIRHEIEWGWLQVGDVEKDVLFVEGLDRNWTATCKKKLHQYCRDSTLDGLVRRKFVITRTTFNRKDLEWGTGAPVIVKWADVWATKLPTTPNYGEGTRSQYKAAMPPDTNTRWNSGYTQKLTAKEIAEDYIAEGKKICWMPVQGNSRRAKILNAPIVYVPTQRQQKFKRLFPTIKRADEVIEAACALFEATLSADEKIALSNPYAFSDWKGADPADYDDPAVKRHIRLANLDVSKKREKASELGLEIRSPGYNNPMGNYPLARGRNHEHHTRIYMNAVYAAGRSTAA